MLTYTGFASTLSNRTEADFEEIPCRPMGGAPASSVTNVCPWSSSNSTPFATRECCAKPELGVQNAGDQKPRKEGTPPAIVRLLSERIVSSATFALPMSLTNAECGWESGESSGDFD